MLHPMRANELNKVREYYEGFNDRKCLDGKLTEHSSQTVTAYGTRRLRNTAATKHS